MKFPFYKQHDIMDCGPTCLKIVGKHYGKILNIQRIREYSGINKDGVSLLGISHAAEKLGFRTMAVKIPTQKLLKLDLPCILYWNKNHFVVLYKIKKNKYYISDPSKGLICYTSAEFKSKWITDRTENSEEGIGLAISPTPKFYDIEEEPEKRAKLSSILRYITGYKQLILQLLVALLVGTCMQLILPFLTQSVVDIGINTRNLNFIYVVLIAQTMLFIGRLSVDFIRSWILLHISTRINISILTDFFIKLLNLPMSFFDTRLTGDIMQRIEDQKRIETFLTGPTLNAFFSLFNFVVFAVVLGFYNTTVFMVFLIGSVLYGIWIAAFLKKRKELDYKRFDISAKNQSKIVQLIAGIQEIKLNNSEQQKRWEWEKIQAGLFQFNIKSLALRQIQQAGSFFINEGKNIVITFIVAKSVIDGQLTLGAMMAIQYIIGQLNSPVEQMVALTQQLQDAKISLERLNEINSLDDEEVSGAHYIYEFPIDKSISLNGLSFTYPGAGNIPVLSNIDLTIPQGKTTAIVGMSGSGKTTLLKLLLRFYEPQMGTIKLGKIALNQFSYKFWRSECGVVMQEGFIFSDTIANNITVAEDIPNLTRLKYAIQMANISDFIDSLPLGLNTKIGAEGNGVSQGQKQRILIARAVYKDPEYIFLDEATNALDANNEKEIMSNLEDFLKNKTVVVVAHRLSTVTNADNIIVLDRGVITEQGTHLELTNLKGSYYQLVKNQLQLGS
ncbi:peptidase domain-containing ABC transporter [Pedobacter sandarakinus]|uniref:peptidase domain-containing ABC transporter n=1 Tax=Pedobacter sandarakinus TaxID=353156 RepID=UPI002245C20E|nr:peptidase domain-containing ABC transporter [Pedobacter sandarakinus]MCX2575956.1 peptidase domain-containing ABC transporter [Pedobacter sandarakinus]